MVKIWRRLFTGDGVAFPEALGRSIDASGKTADLQKLVSKGQAWQVEKEPHKL